MADGNRILCPFHPVAALLVNGYKDNLVDGVRCGTWALAEKHIPPKLLCFTGTAHKKGWLILALFYFIDLSLASLKCSHRTLLLCECETEKVLRF